ncbi:hypothetical protein PLIIFM63780_007783 [Purpureocillium lilacinum]|nr:hypothetical protein PLIIFM63780_007783 [Purpureocillium lilacinum]
MAPSADPINPQHDPSFEPFNRGGPTTMNGINGVNGGSHDHAHGPATPANGSKRVDSPGRGRSQSAAESGPVRADKDHRTDDRSEHVHSTRKRGASGPVKKTLSHDNVQRLSAAEMQELTSSPDSLPIAPAPQPLSIEQQDLGSPSLEMRLDFRQHARQLYPDGDATANGVPVESRAGRGYWKFDDSARRPLHAPRTVSTPPTTRIQPADGTPYSSSPRRFSFNPSPRPPPLSLNGDGPNGFLAAHMPPPAIQSASPSLASQQPAPAPSPARGSRPPSPIPAMIPLPPMSLPTHLQLELAAQRPSPLYIHHSHSNDIPYESSSEKFERLKNVLLLPPYLERVLNFGALACLDAWLYTFTILPVRFIMALAILIRWWGYVVGKETMWLVGYVWYGLGRLWRRGRHDQSRRPSNASEGDRSRSRSRVRELHVDTDTKTPNPRERSLQTRRELHADGASETLKSPVPTRDPGPKTGAFRHRRTKSTPSSLSAFHKADLLQGAVIICSSLALMTLDASRMYHFIRAQSAIKLYVIYNILEVGDRLLSALGQDILECLFSSETLSRNASGRSKVLLPLGMFMLALAYNCLHSIALYYQVITLNVAVNSYSNALLTLLLSNQFVEIKSTVFKRFEKDNLFQLTCADIVERFHLWIMLLIIGMRNVVEVGGLSVPGAGLDSTYDDAGPVPLHPPSILPHSFTVLPSWLMSGEVLSPFLIVVGSEMLVDSIKHAYVTKFNNIKPTFYSRTLDILCKDYYTNTYHMFLSTHIPMPLPQSTQTSLTEESATPSSPAMMAALNRFDSLIRDSLGRATYGYPYGSPLNSRSWYSWTSDDFIAALTMVVVFFIAFLVLLILKLLLGMLLLKYARNRYVKMKHKEQLVARGAAAPESYDALGRRVGGRGEVEVSDDKQRWIHADKTEGLRGGKGPGGKRPAGGGADDKGKKQEGEYQGVFRYEMVAKRIW